MKNYYNILGISDDASIQVVNDAYRKLALKFHPDKNDGDLFFDHWFKEINEAKQILTDEDERAEYDFKLNNYSDAYELIKQQQAQENHERLYKRKRFVQAKARNKQFFAASGMIVVLAAIFFIFLETKNEDFGREGNTGMLAKMEPVKDDVDTPAVLAFTSASQIDAGKMEEKQTVKLIAEPVNKVAVQQAKPPVERESITAKILTRVSEDEIPLADIAEKNERALTDIEVKEILSLLKQNNGKNCVQVIQTYASTIKPDFAIALVLQKHGYIIAGREISNEKRSGFSIANNGDCTKLFIGN